MQELSGGPPVGNGEAPQRIEAGPGGYENGNADAYGGGDRDLKPWQRGPTGAAAPWQQRGGEDRGRRDDYPPRDGGSGSAPPWAAGGRGDDSYGYGQQSGGYGAPPGPPGGAAPWQQQAPPPPGGQQSYGGYGAYPGAGYGDNNAAFPPQSSMGAPPGLGGASSGLGAPPGLGALFQNYGAPGSAGSPPPPPPPGDAPPPPVSDHVCCCRYDRGLTIYSLQATSLLRHHLPVLSFA